MTKFHLIVTTLLVWTASSFAQVVVIDKVKPTITDVVTITFDAKQGNGGLAGFTGDVYAYSGVITDKSTSDSDWKHILNDWNVVNPKAKMTSLGNDLYSLTFTIADLYSVLASEKVVKLAFIFTNSSYTQIGRDVGGKDILVVLDNTNYYVGENYISHQYANNILKVVGEKGTLEFTYFKSDVVKTEYHPNGVTIKDTTFTVVQVPQAVSLNLVDNASNLNLSSSELQVVVKKSPLKIYFVKGSDTTLCDYNGYVASNGGGGSSFQVKSDEAYYGSGSRAIPINRRGQNLTVYNMQSGGYGNGTPNLNISIPFVISNKGYGLFFDNYHPMQLDLGATNSKVFNATTEGGALRYYYIGGDSYETILDNYTQLTGKQSMPPMWSLGYIQSKYGYQTEAEARKIVTDLRAAKFPVEGLVLDLYWFGQMGDMGNLNWNKTQFPNPTKMMSDFKALNVKTILITEPYFTVASTNYNTLATNNLFTTTSNGTPYVINGFWTGNSASLIDITKKAATDWMWNSYRDRRNEGVAGWWCDLGEPETHPSDMQHSLGSTSAVHNIYSLLWAKMLSENYAKEFGNERLFNLIRSGFAGMQRYSTFPWSGDISRSWSGLSAQVPIMLGSGMSGIGYMHSDAGGFTDNGNDGELFARWIQFAVFSPILRIHGCGNVEPIKYTEPYKSIARNYINLRYKLLPYNYTLAYENTTKGLPLARQSDFYEPNNTALKNLNDQYLWGENLLVAPILATNTTSRTVQFPSGTWIDFFTNKAYSGSASIPCTINNLLLFAKAGSFIPMAANSVKNTTSYTTDSLDVAYFPTPSVPTSNYTLYIDNGTSTTALSTNNFELIQFNGNVSASQIVVNVSKSATTFSTAPTSRDMQFRIKQIASKPTNVDVNGSNAFSATNLTEFAQHTPAWYYDATAKEVIAHFTWSGQNTALTLSDAVTSQSTLLANATDFYLNAPTPNPVRDEASIDYYLSAQGNYTLSIYNAMGTLINLVYLNDAPVGAGTYNWQASALPAGLYFIKLSDNSKTVSVKVIKE